jgi:Protein of unknown function (DUF4038)/Domain of unknown function (DUF5060)/Putative collagen-binding domain of a collagenase
MKRLLTAAALLALLGCRPSPPPAPEGPAVEMWGVWEETFTAAQIAPAETELRVSLRSPSGAEHEIEGFWDGGLNWLARFMPSEEGVWQYEARWQTPEGSKPATSGNFVCVRAESSKNPLLQHGPVRVSADGHYFEHADGTPFFWLADTAWNGALLSDDASWQNYLDDRVAKGFSGIQFVTTQWRAAYQNAEGQVAYSGFDNIEIHPEFFARLDRRISEINAKGLLAVPVVLWGLGDEQHTPGKLPVEQAVRLARYIVNRYQAHHVAWFLGGDSAYDGENGERWKRIGRAVFGDREHAAVFLHPQGMHWPWDGFQNEKWLSALGYQSGHGDDAATLRWIHSGPPAQEWPKPPARPIINLEPPYEDHVAYQSRKRHTAYNVRRAMYWSLLNAPTAGVSYGAHGVWSWQTSSGVPLNHERSGEAKPWQEAILLPGSTHMRYMAELFRSLPWWRLRPAPALLAGQPGAKDPARFVSAALSQDNDAAIFYLPAGEKIRLNTAALPQKLSQAEWFDPRTGEPRPAGGSGGVYQAPGREDWVLVLRAGVAP